MWCYLENSQDTFHQPVLGMEMNPYFIAFISLSSNPLKFYYQISLGLY